MIDNLKYASLVIPQIIADAIDIANVSEYPVSAMFNNSFLFYNKLLISPNEWIQYDYFNFIPLTYDEIIIYVYYSDQFNTLLTNKITNKKNKLIYIP